ncbi:hypothetical protein [Thiolinea disciformis]|uniref:hypothetical protein n=1 Tax=Thiolinea disciformis TaxID=125614 RepID=UPI00036096C3|nr:hypothetical protein [Thiolinea disciformis]
MDTLITIIIALILSAAIYMYSSYKNLIPRTSFSPLPLIKWSLFTVSAGFNAFMFYGMLSPFNELLAVIMAAAVIGVTFAAEKVIRTCFASWRHGLMLTFRITLVGLLILTTYSLIAEHTAFAAILHKNRDAQYALQLDLQASNARIESNRKNLEAVDLRNRDALNRLETRARLNAQALNQQAHEQQYQAELLRNKKPEIIPSFFGQTLGIGFVASLFSIALQFAVIGIVIFEELFHRPTPLQAVVKFENKILSWSPHSNQLQNLYVTTSPANGVIAIPPAQLAHQKTALPHHTPKAPPTLPSKVSDLTSKAEEGALEAAYQQWVEQVENGQIKPTFPPTELFIKKANLVANNIEAQNLAGQWLDRAFDDGVLEYDLPFVNGKSKYKLAPKRF